MFSYFIIPKMALCLDLFRFILKFFVVFNLSLTPTFAALFLSETHTSNTVEEEKLYMLMSPGVEIEKNGSREIQIFCQENMTKSLLYLWKSSYVTFVKAPNNFKMYSGENATSVISQYKSETAWYPATWTSWHGTTIPFPAFGPYCLGVLSSESYCLQLVVKTVNYWRILQLLIGILLFYYANKLSRNTIFHYTSGISVGVVASVLVLLYIVAKLIPKKSAAIMFFVISYSVALYYLHLIYSSLQSAVENYTTFILAYIVITAVISFALCYRFGPVTNIKTCRLIEWSIQLSSLLLIFFSTEQREVSTAIIMVMLSLYVIPAKWIASVKVMWYRRFPKKIKFLTETEYIEQGMRETEKALTELREFCNSPECRAWRVVPKLKDPQRFAKFINGEISHLTDEEILMYDLDSYTELQKSSNQADDGDSDSDYNHSSTSFLNQSPGGLFRNENTSALNNHVSHRNSVNS